jgi:hypothetical protein
MNGPVRCLTISRNSAALFYDRQWWLEAMSFENGRPQSGAT